jgi:hypothetical protein
MFKERIITIWMIVYDGDASRVYTTTSFDKMLASIEGSLRGYCGDETPALEEMYQQVIDRIKAAEEQPAIPMRFNNLHVVVYRWEIDGSNPIHHILGQCYSAVEDPDLREQIDSLFSASVFT